MVQIRFKKNLRYSFFHCNLGKIFNLLPDNSNSTLIWSVKLKNAGSKEDRAKELTR